MKILAVATTLVAMFFSFAATSSATDQPTKGDHCVKATICYADEERAKDVPKLRVTHERSRVYHAPRPRVHRHYSGLVKVCRCLPSTEWALCKTGTWWASS